MGKKAVVIIVKFFVLVGRERTCDLSLTFLNAHYIYL